MELPEPPPAFKRQMFLLWAQDAIEVLLSKGGNVAFLAGVDAEGRLYIVPFVTLKEEELLTIGRTLLNSPDVMGHVTFVAGQMIDTEEGGKSH